MYFTYQSRPGLQVFSVPSWQNLSPTLNFPAQRLGCLLPEALSYMIQTLWSPLALSLPFSLCAHNLMSFYCQNRKTPTFFPPQPFCAVTTSASKLISVLNSYLWHYLSIIPPKFRKVGRHSFTNLFSFALASQGQHERSCKTVFQAQSNRGQIRCVQSKS